MKRPTWLYRLVPYLGRRQAEADVQEELRLHLALERERQIDAGIPEDEALRAARRKLGNATLIRERTRDVWGWRWLDDLGRDVSEQRAEAFVPADQTAAARSIGAMFVTVRTTGAPLALVPFLREVVVEARTPARRSTT